MTAETSTDVMRRYLQDAIAAESSFESQLRGYASGDSDEEVNQVFAAHAEATALQCQRLTARLEELGGHASSTKSFWAHLFSLSPRVAQVGHKRSERTTQNLIIAFAVESGEWAMYEALAAAAQAAGDPVTEALAREIQAEEQHTAEQIGRLIASRAKIAWNTVTAGETDPSVLTKAAENRLV